MSSATARSHRSRSRASRRTAAHSSVSCGISLLRLKRLSLRRFRCAYGSGRAGYVKASGFSVTAFDTVTVRYCSVLSSISSTKSRSVWSPDFPLIRAWDRFFGEEEDPRFPDRPPRRLRDMEEGVPALRPPGVRSSSGDLEGPAPPRRDSGVTCAAAVETTTPSIGPPDPRADERSGVGRVGEPFSAATLFSACTAAAEIAMLFISVRAGASWPGSAAVNAFTAGWTISPILRTKDCWYGHTWLVLG
mmetsp:Transcript_3963/g.10376  ORF Transcript_3963/g.10376 Transcript_3963/m.10376 type:complete len:247 (-) Transcript_3963:4174-4914(-)